MSIDLRLPENTEHTNTDARAVVSPEHVRAHERSGVLVVDAVARGRAERRLVRTGDALMPTSRVARWMKTASLSETTECLLAMEHALARCESPIEQLVAIAFLSSERWSPIVGGLSAEEIAAGWIGIRGDTSSPIFLSTQYKPCGKRLGKFRVDFMVGCADPRIKIAIECDGHEFHERTPEQAERDKSRDRDFAASGWTVLRFTGREIHRDSSVVVDAVEKVLKRAIPQGARP